MNSVLHKAILLAALVGVCFAAGHAFSADHAAHASGQEPCVLCTVLAVAVLGLFSSNFIYVPRAAVGLRGRTDAIPGLLEAQGPLRLRAPPSSSS